jgi:hypothetical protein
MHQPHAGGLDELPRILDLVLGDPGGKGCGGLIVPAQERESLVTIQPGDEPRRPAAERSAAVEEQERPVRRRNVPEPRPIEHEAIHGRTVTVAPIRPQSGRAGIVGVVHSRLQRPLGGPHSSVGAVIGGGFTGPH